MKTTIINGRLDRYTEDHSVPADNNTATHPMNLPSDEHPEFWDGEALEKFIAKRKLEWLKEPDSTDNIHQAPEGADWLGAHSLVYADGRL